jgi:hypothetical protein
MKEGRRRKEGRKEGKKVKKEGTRTGGVKGRRKEGRLVK